MAIDPERRAEINRENASKSTGPKTDEGKAASRCNALKHGLTSTTIASVGPPGEEPGDFQKRLDWWIDDLKPQNVLELAMVRQACRATWKLDRCARFEDAAACHRASRPAGGGANADGRAPERARASRLGAILMAAVDAPPRELLRVKGCPDGPPGPVHSPLNDAPRDADELASFLEGVDWLLAEWARVLADLAADGDEPEGSDEFIGRTEAKALRLLGVATGGAVPTQPLREAGEAELRRLEKRRGLLAEEPSARIDRDLTLLEAGPTADLLLRYESGAERELHRATSALVNLRKHAELLDPEPEPVAPPAPAPAPPYTTSRRSTPPARNEAIRNDRLDPDSAPHPTFAEWQAARNRP